ncbi:MAG: alpha/beta hydrolase [Cyclobacteriaceae bacterium]
MKDQIKRRKFILSSTALLGSAGLGAFSAILSQSAPRNPEPPFLGEEFYLWDDNSPNNGSHEQYRPRVRLYYPSLRGNMYEGNKFPVVLICPGGGYHVQAHHEGQPFAQLFAMHGIVGAVLTYRVFPDRYPAAYADATRAMRMLRAKAGQYALDPERVAIMGFSAGGHLASTVATQPELYKEPEDNLADQFSARPDRVILGYPVISFTDYAHEGSAKAILGENPDPKMREQLSNHKQVTPDAPPAFLFHTADDTAVPVQNSLMYASACLEHEVPVELHVFPKGRHGVGMSLENPALSIWSENLMNWLRDWKILV